MFHIKQDMEEKHMDDLPLSIELVFNTMDEEKYQGSIGDGEPDHMDLYLKYQRKHYVDTNIYIRSAAHIFPFCIPFSDKRSLHVSAYYGSPYYYQLTDLYHAIVENKVYEVMRLLEKGMDINLHRLGVKTALTVACEKRQRKGLDMVRLLVENAKYPADLNQKDGLGFTPLMTAVSAGTYGLCCYLLHKGCDVNLTVTQEGTFEHYTALHFAIRRDRYDICHLLLKNGSQVNVCKGDTPLGLTVGKGLAILDLLLEHNVDVNLSTHEESDERRCEVLDKVSCNVAYNFLERGFRFIDHPPSGRNNHLLWALSIGDETRSIMLLEWGFDIGKPLWCNDAGYLINALKHRLFKVYRMMVIINPYLLNERWTLDRPTISALPEEAHNLLLEESSQPQSLYALCRSRILLQLVSVSKTASGQRKISSMIEELYTLFPRQLKLSPFEKEESK